MNTTIQDFPGRTGYWHIGVPPSGPMDSFAFRVANALVGNGEAAAALEVTLSGASRWHRFAWVWPLHASSLCTRRRPEGERPGKPPP